MRVCAERRRKCLSLSRKQTDPSLCGLGAKVDVKRKEGGRDQERESRQRHKRSETLISSLS